MITKSVGALIAATSSLVVANACFATEAFFYKAPRNYAAEGLLGKVYRRELETRMFTHPTWSERLYCNRDEPDIDETLEVYSKPDGSRWLNYRRATPSFSRLIRSRILGDAKFDLKKELDAVHVVSQEAALPTEVATEIELLWRTMLPGLPNEPKEPEHGVTHTVYLNVTVLIAFAKEDRSIKTGSIAMVMHNTPAYRAFTGIVDDLIKLCHAKGIPRDRIFAELPGKMRDLRLSLANKR
jgi:hypothetical protein